MKYLRTREKTLDNPLESEGLGQMLEKPADMRPHFVSIVAVPSDEASMQLSIDSLARQLAY